jgi:DNA mismatch repair ATPase MutS
MAFAQDAQKDQKNECLLIAKGCKDEVDSIQQKIKKIRAEIKKGTKVYTPEELKQLDQKLKEANDIIIQLEKPRGK